MTTKKNGHGAAAKGIGPEIAKAPVDTDTLPDIRANVLDTRDRELLGRGQRLLTIIQSPLYASRAARSGYTSEEHKEGWTLLNAASGQNRRLEDCFLATRTTPQAGYDMTLLIAIDELENTWFPRTHAIIRRVVDAEHRDELEASFFRDLDQQPLGPGVVLSVRTFLSRLDDLQKSAEPNAKEVFAKIESRGLTRSVRDQMNELVSRAEVVGEVTGAEAMRKVAAGQKAQQEAVARFRDWFNDWATTLRTVFPSARAQVQLGLTTLSRSSGGADEPVVDDGEQPAPVVPVGGPGKPGEVAPGPGNPG